MFGLEERIILHDLTNTFLEGEAATNPKAKFGRSKERAIQSRLEQVFEDNLRQIAESIHKKGGTKKYQKVCKRIGRLKEKYAHFYTIRVEEKNGLADKIYIKKANSDKNSQTAIICVLLEQTLGKKRFWDIYTMLTELEDAFRAIKSEMLIRPIYHQKESRSDAHIFITVIAYHISAPG